jgi:hypothetical protein
MLPSREVRARRANPARCAIFRRTRRAGDPEATSASLRELREEEDSDVPIRARLRPFAVVGAIASAIALDRDASADESGARPGPDAALEAKG